MPPGKAVCVIATRAAWRISWQTFAALTIGFHLADLNLCTFWVPESLQPVLAPTMMFIGADAPAITLGMTSYVRSTLRQR